MGSLFNRTYFIQGGVLQDALKGDSFVNSFYIDGRDTFLSPRLNMEIDLHRGFYKNPVESQILLYNLSDAMIDQLHQNRVALDIFLGYRDSILEPNHHFFVGRYYVYGLSEAGGMDKSYVLSLKNTAHGDETRGYETKGLLSFKSTQNIKSAFERTAKQMLVKISSDFYTYLEREGVDVSKKFMGNISRKGAYYKTFEYLLKMMQSKNSVLDFTMDNGVIYPPRDHLYGEETVVLEGYSGLKKKTKMSVSKVHGDGFENDKDMRLTTYIMASMKPGVNVRFGRDLGDHGTYRVVETNYRGVVDGNQWELLSKATRY